eukprot:snap_masked-scaffold_1-processed-gene-0.14-mRNA-1 protein AED:1.00 eAED:1.00 QI:0/0/0/0/1/1/3/0/69
MSSRRKKFTSYWTKSVININNIPLITVHWCILWFDYSKSQKIFYFGDGSILYLTLQKPDLADQCLVNCY